MRFVFAVAAALLVLPASAAGDAEAGKTVFAKCAACHTIGPDAKNKIGPVLNGVVGRVPGSLADFNYSQAMRDFGTANGAWTEETIGKYLENPKETVPGNKMAFIGLKKPEDRDNVIAFLKANP